MGNPSYGKSQRRSPRPGVAMQKETACPDCGAVLRVTPDMVGDIATCKHCGQAFPIIVAATRATIGETSASTCASPPTVAPIVPSAPTGGKRIGTRYSVKGQLGQGAFGVVYHAEDQVLKRPVAIKMLRPEVVQSEDAVRRLKREAEVLSQVVHPNILPVLEFGQCPEGHYVVFPLVKGKTLLDAIPSGGFGDPRQAVRLVIKLLMALHFVYEKHHILHRDVKPANVLLLEGTDDLYLTDFGLVHCQQSNLTRLTTDRMVMGTPAFMSPEQAMGDHQLIGHRSDLYAAGVVLFELLTGRLPFEAGFPAILSEVVSKAPPAPSAFRPDIDRGLDAIVLKVLSKKPEGRYSTGKEFADVLEQWLQKGSTAVNPRLSGPVPARVTTPAPYTRAPRSPVQPLPAPPRSSRLSLPPPPSPPRSRRRVLWLVAAGVTILAGLIGGAFFLLKG
jgi:serine/threonine protein kinase/ribosomal protein L37AE/L43A